MSGDDKVTRASPSSRRTQLRSTFSIGGQRQSHLLTGVSPLATSNPPESTEPIPKPNPPSPKVTPVKKGNLAGSTPTSPLASPRSRKPRRATGFQKPLRVSQVPGASPLPIRLSLETPAVARARSAQNSKTDILLRQKKVVFTGILDGL